MFGEAHKQRAAEQLSEQLAGAVTAWGWRPAWEAPEGLPGPARRGMFPPPGAPSLDQLDYAQKFIGVSLLLLALPVLLLTLVRSPGRAARAAARKQLGAVP